MLGFLPRLRLGPQLCPGGGLVDTDALSAAERVVRVDFEGRLVGPVRIEPRNVPGPERRGGGGRRMRVRGGRNRSRYTSIT